ncbi:MAG TPA: HupE/UreJ family protein [Candidatus Binatia bacterium]|jgi:hypothetical protein|nr:HupE/UreJ family protein [Candidatus Binatia bacterium]
MRGAFLLLVVLAAPAVAHERSTSWAVWDLGLHEAGVTFRTSALEASRLPWPPGDTTRFGNYLTDRIRLVAGETPCMPVASPHALVAPPGRLALAWRVRCDADGPLRIESTAFLDVAPSHLHFVRVRHADGTSTERVLSDGLRAWRLGDDGAPSLLASTRLGLEHILSGPDHLAFVLALLLLAGTVGETLRIVTGFTIAHSLTLAAATLGFVHPEQAPVEALIGLSVALVAAENVWLAGTRGTVLPLLTASVLLALSLLAALGIGNVPALALVGIALFSACHLLRLRRSGTPLRLRWGAAFAFGLLHGFGFASVLVEAAFPPLDLARVLLGFNVGVELGQLAIVVLVFPLIVAAGRWRPLVAEVGSAALAGLGVFWFATRAFG